jgi:mannose/fructose/N-acetylgalactosamine-specific phosphotransferase system component IIC
MLIGLSRTLYVEFTLSALMALVFVFWLRFLRRTDLSSGLAFGATLSLAFMTKLTLPVFMILPVAGATLASMANRDFRRAERLVFATTVPIASAIAIHATVFPTSMGYYVMAASTSLPFMHLMGPTEWYSWSSATYYVREIGETFLFLLTPFLLMSLWLAVPRIRATRLGDLSGSRAALWLWLLSPVLILVLHPLKEPRHVAASIVPAVLLIVLGIEDLAKPRARRAAVGIAVALACTQYLAVTRGFVDVPYFMDRAIHYSEIRDRIAAVDNRAMYETTPADLRLLHWNYNQNVALAGFQANEALALTWQGFPGVVFDLDTFDLSGGDFEAAPYEQFEDLFFLAAINTYNRRCGWHLYRPTLSREVVVENAEILILNDDGRGEVLKRFPDHVQFASITRKGGVIHLLRAIRQTEPYRVLYARHFLERFPELEEDEVRVVALEMLMAAVLDGDRSRARAVARDFPSLDGAKTPPRNIYWIGGYPALIGLAAKLGDNPPN